MSRERKHSVVSAASGGIDDIPAVEVTLLPGASIDDEIGLPPAGRPSSSRASGSKPGQHESPQGRSGSKKADYSATNRAGSKPSCVSEHNVRAGSKRSSASERVSSSTMNVTNVFDNAYANHADDPERILDSVGSGRLSDADATFFPTEKRIAALANKQQSNADEVGGDSLEPESSDVQLWRPRHRGDFYEGNGANPDEDLTPQEEPSEGNPLNLRLLKPIAGGVVASRLPARSSGDRPGSGGSNAPVYNPGKAEPSVAAQMPDHLRKRLESNRIADRNDVRKSKRTNAGDDEPNANQLPSISRGRGRCSSLQARERPAGVVVGDSSSPEQKKVARPLSADAAEEEEEEKCERQMFDKNTLRANYKELFAGAIAKRREELLNPKGGARQETAAGLGFVRVYVRKRPIFEKEEQGKGDYDVVTVLPGAPPMRIVLHNCLFQADLKTPYIHQYTFQFDRVYGGEVENEEVYRDSAEQLVQSVRAGNMGTMFMFGQTGSGKTHTMTSIEEMAARDLFEGVTGDDSWISIQFMELQGDLCFDLLVEGVKEKGGVVRPKLPLREIKDGSYIAEGASTVTPKSAKELCSIMVRAHARRATCATDANDVSSRSHAVCILRLLKTGGQLMLVDCAGTERRKDSMYHSKERQVEGAQINASLYALKECMRYLTTKGQVPSHIFRMSSLTKTLADAFTRSRKSQMAVICTASPCASDTDHTLTTLRTGVSLCSQGREHDQKQSLKEYIDSLRKPKAPHPKTWTTEQIRAWVADLAGGEFSDLVFPGGFTGQMLVRLTEARCVQLCGGNQKRGRRFFGLLHEEMLRDR